MTILQDIRYGVRVLLKSPGFLIAAVLSLALGIGANTTIFTMVNSVFLQPLPVEKPAELMYIYGTDANNTQNVLGSFLPISYPNYLDYRNQSDSFQDIGVYSFPTAVSLGGGDKPAPLTVELVSANYFPLLGVRPSLGRGFLAEEDQTPGTHSVVVLNYKFWQRQFGGNPGAIGETIRLNGTPFTIIGVAPSGFDGTFTILAPDLWAPAMSFPYLTALPNAGGPLDKNRRLLFFNVFGRLKPGVAMTQARAALQTIGKRLENEYPNENKGRSAGILPLSEATVPPVVRTILLQGSILLMVIVGLVLLIACANIANLMMARATARRREFAVRLALGGARSRLIAQLLTESVLVAIPGGLLAIIVAWQGRNLILSLLPPVINAANVNMSIDMRVLGFTFALAVASGIVFGLVPALRASKSDLAVDLKDRAGSSAPQGRINSRNLLVFFQVALSFVALASAGLFIRSLSNAENVNLGFEQDKLVVVSYDLTTNGYNEERGKEFHRQVLQRMRSLPGVAAATLATNPPLSPPFQRSVFPEGQENVATQNGVLVYTESIVPGYFDAVRIPLLRGRDFTEADRDGSIPAVVVNEAMAHRFWPNQDAMGKRFRFFGDSQERAIVGIARNAKYIFVGEDPQPFAYLPLDQNYSAFMTVHVRTTGRPDSLKGTIERELRSLDRDVAQANLATSPELLQNSLWAPRLAATLLSIFGGVALVLAAVGIYGVMSYSVNQRASEIGIRMALGARKSDVLRMVLRQGMTVVSVGLATGLILSVAVAGLLSRLLYGVGRTDIAAFGGTAATLLLVALVANYIPARRATAVDPVTVMKAE